MFSWFQMDSYRFWWFCFYCDDLFSTVLSFSQPLVDQNHNRNKKYKTNCYCILAGVQLVWGRFQKLRLELSPLGAPTREGPMPPLVTGHRWYMSFHVVANQGPICPNLGWFTGSATVYFIIWGQLCCVPKFTGLVARKKNCPYYYYVIPIHEQNGGFWWKLPGKSLVSGCFC